MTTTRHPVPSVDAGRLAEPEIGPKARHRHAARHLVRGDDRVDRRSRHGLRSGRRQGRRLGGPAACRTRTGSRAPASGSRAASGCRRAGCPTRHGSPRTSPPASRCRCRGRPRGRDRGRACRADSRSSPRRSRGPCRAPGRRRPRGTLGRRRSVPRCGAARRLLQLRALGRTRTGSRGRASGSPAASGCRRAGCPTRHGSPRTSPPASRCRCQVRLEVEIEVEHVGRIAGLLRDDREDLVPDRVAGDGRRRRRRVRSAPEPRPGTARRALRSGRRSYTNWIACASVGKSRSLRLSSRGMSVGRADRGERLRLLHRVDRRGPPQDRGRAPACRAGSPVFSATIASTLSCTASDAGAAATGAAAAGAAVSERASPAAAGAGTEATTRAAAPASFTRSVRCTTSTCGAS